MPKILALAASIVAAPVAADAAPPPENFPLPPESQRRADGVEPGETLSFEWNDSQTFPGTRRKIRVYVPAAYDGKTPACTAVFQDGGDYRFEIVFDNLIAAGEMPVTIGVIVPSGGVPGVVDPSGLRHNRTFEYDSPGERYAHFLLNEILPAVEKLRTADGRPVRLSHDGNDRMIAGGSSGAAAAFNAAWALPHEFPRVCSAIGSYTGLRGSHIYPTLIHKTEPKPLRIFVQSGTGDMWTSFGDWWSANNAMVRALDFAGYEFDHEFGDGRHSPVHMTALFPRVMRYLWKGWPASVKAGTTSRNHILRAALPPATRWEIAAELPAGAGTGDGGGDVTTPAKLRADKDGVLHLSLAIKKTMDKTRQQNLPAPADSNRPVIFRLAPGGTWEPAGAGVLMAFDKDGVTRLVRTNWHRHQTPNPPDMPMPVPDDATLERLIPDGAARTPVRRIPDQWDSVAVATNGDIYAADKSGNIFMVRHRAEGENSAKAKLVHPGGERGGEREPGENLHSWTLAISCDGNWLAGIEGRTTRGHSWRLEKDGTLAFGQTFHVLHKRDEDDDSRATDVAAEASGNGFMYVATASGVQILDANGRTGAILPLPGGAAVLSICFGGPDFRTLHALGSDGKIYSRPVKNSGALPWRPAAAITAKAG
ncbi:MAG: hypothetical protein LBK99_05630 [Opitutaceae bacterium]|jgi:hypothetical protein|nr:hypothetical protein [Opitutaceae bacterium]